jgi:hypothetical protein
VSQRKSNKEQNLWADDAPTSRKTDIWILITIGGPFLLHFSSRLASAPGNAFECLLLLEVHLQIDEKSPTTFVLGKTPREHRFMIMVGPWFLCSNTV